MRYLAIVSALALVGSAWAATQVDMVGPSTAWSGAVSSSRAVLYDNFPGVGESVFTTGSAPRTGGADEVLFAGPAALVNSMRFGYSVATGGPAAFDVRFRFWDDINFTAGAGVPQFQNLVADATLALTGQTAGAWLSGPVSLASLPGGGVSVTSNPVNFNNIPNITDFYLQIDFYQPGTTTPVLNNLVTYIFDGSGVNVGYTFASPAVGGTGAVAEEVFWRDVNANGIITGDEARSFAAPNRANFVLQFEGDVIPEPASLALLAFALVLRRR